MRRKFPVVAGRSWDWLGVKQLIRLALYSVAWAARVFSEAGKTGTPNRALGSA
jgi:hypothetical protein